MLLRNFKKKLILLKLQRLAQLKENYLRIFKKSTYINKNITKREATIHTIILTKRYTNKRNKCCMYTGRYKGYLNVFGLSRHAINHAVKIETVCSFNLKPK